MKIRIFALIAGIAFLIAPAARCQTDSIVHVNQFPGLTVGDKVSSAMNHCPAAPVQCYLVLDASLGAAAAGTMPSLPANAQLVDFRKAWPGSYTNNIQLPALCPSASTDMGACINAAIQALPAAPTGGEVDIPVNPAGGCWPVSTQIVIDRPVHLHGQTYGFFGAGACLNWTGGASTMIEIDPASHAASSSNIDYLSLVNHGSATVAIDIDNSQYNVVVNHVSIDIGGPPFSVAGIRLGATNASPTIDTLLQDVRIGNQNVGLLILIANTTECDNCHIYDSSIANVQIGTAGGNFSFATKFQGGEIEQDTNTLTGPNVLIYDADSVWMTDLYMEIAANNSTAISIPSSAIHAEGIVWKGGYINMNGATGATALNTASSLTDAVVEDVTLDWAGTGASLFANSAFHTLTAKNVFQISTEVVAFQISTTSTTGIDIQNVLGKNQRILDKSGTVCWQNQAGSGYDCLNKDAGDNLEFPNNIYANGIMQGSFGKTATYTVSGLPSAASVGAGTFAIVTDASTATIGTCTGGGSTVMLAVSNGTTWTCH